MPLNFNTEEWFYKEDYRYADSRLKHTVIPAKNGDLIYVEGVYSVDHVESFCVRTGDRIGRLAFSAFDLRLPVKLGAVQVDDVAGFTFREPRRRFKHGLSFDTLSSTDLKFMRVFKETAKGYRPIVQPHYNLYPSIKEACHLLEDCFTSVAVTNNIILDDSFRVLWRGYEVGVYNPDKGLITLNERYKYLNEVVSQDLPTEVVR